MGFWESIGFWFAKAMVEFLIGVAIVAVFVIILLYQEHKNRKWNEQRKASKKVSAKGTQSS